MRTISSPAEKWCPLCEQRKPQSDFYKSKKSPDGLTWNCQECAIKTAKQDTIYKARHRALHPDREDARYQLQKARSNGLILNHCSWPVCTETENIEGHHPDYSKPYEIVSVCRLHHKAADLLGDKLGFDLSIIDIRQNNNTQTKG